MLIQTILQEKRRIERMMKRYNEMLAILPKGKLSERVIKGNIYYYLKYRKGKKVVSEYIRKEKLLETQAGLQKRTHVEAMLASLQEEYNLAQKVLEMMV